MINKQCIAGDPLEPPGGIEDQLLCYINHARSCREPANKTRETTVKQVQCSITMMSSCYSSQQSVIYYQ